MIDGDPSPASSKSAFEWKTEELGMVRKPKGVEVRSVSYSIKVAEGVIVIGKEAKAEAPGGNHDVEKQVRNPTS